MTRLIATFGGVGDLRPRPAHGAAPPHCPLPGPSTRLAASGLLAIATVAITAIGWWAVEREVRHSADKDPSEIVIDEVAGQFVALWPVSFGAMFAGLGLLDLWPGIVTAFLAFRLFDIWKPGPVGWADRQEGALGVMADDLIAGWLAALVVAVFAVIAHLILIPTP
jgi:phosphatidylglycerophosphatase A